MSHTNPAVLPGSHRRSTRGWRWPALGALATWLLAAALARRAFTGEFDARAGGYDFRPLYDAALAARAHAPLYAVYNYVYPPAAAFAAAPLTLLSWHHALLLALAVEVGALVATCAGAVALVTARERARWVPAITGLAVAALFTPLVTARNLDLANTSLLLPLVVLATCWLWGRGTGTPGRPCSWPPSSSNRCS